MTLSSFIIYKTFFQSQHSYILATDIRTLPLLSRVTQIYHLPITNQQQEYKTKINSLHFADTLLR